LSKRYFNLATKIIIVLLEIFFVNLITNMTTTQQLLKTSTKSNFVQHPLEPLSREEVATAIAIIRNERNLPETIRFTTVVLNEPPKNVVLNFKDGDPINREALIILLDNATGAVYEVVVSLTQKTTIQWKHIPEVQPAIMLDEFIECEAVVKASP
jgi:primary-amine oxidase